MGYEVFISGRYLRAGRKEKFISLITFISILGVTLGVMALIVVIAVMTGFEKDLKARILAVTPHVTVLGHAGITDPEALIKKISSDPDVIGATAYAQAQAMIRSGAGASGAVIKGVEPDRIASVLNLSPAVEEKFVADLAATASDGTRTGIVLGKELARNLGVGTGDLVYVVSPKGSLSPLGHMPSLQRLVVTGTLDTGMFDYDQSMAWMELGAARRLFRSEISGVEVAISDVYQAEQVAGRLVRTLGFPYWARSWASMHKNLFTALALEKAAMFVILTLIVLVAAFNIASTLIMNVLEKRKDIAILKAMGATKKSVRRIFVAQGLFIGAVGTGLGVALGSGLCYLLSRYQFIDLPDNVYYVNTLPVSMEFVDVVTIAAAALVICLGATLYPAWQAQRLDPVEAIRYG